MILESWVIALALLHIRDDLFKLHVLPELAGVRKETALVIHFANGWRTGVRGFIDVTIRGESVELLLALVQVLVVLFFILFEVGRGGEGLLEQLAALLEIESKGIELRLLVGVRVGSCNDIQRPLLLIGLLPWLLANRLLLRGI